MLLPLPQDARSALVVVDMQEFFFRKPERRRNLETVVANINRLIEHFESRQLPVFHVVTSYKADGSDWELKMRAKEKAELIEGSPETAILPQVRVTDSHTVLSKTRYSAFFKTGLAKLLRAENVHRVVVVGAYPITASTPRSMALIITISCPARSPTPSRHICRTKRHC